MMFGDNYQNLFGDPPEHDLGGSQFTVVERTNLKHPADPRSSVAILTCLDLTYRSYFIWDDIFGFYNAYCTTDIKKSQKYFSKVLTDNQYVSEQNNILERYRSEVERISTLSRDEIIDEGRAHKRYGKFWKRLRGPLLLSKSDAGRAAIHWKGFQFRSRAVRNWIEDQGFYAKPCILPVACVSLRPGRYLTVMQKAIDFASEEEATVFKLTWF